jgi:hypothetical protein
VSEDERFPQLRDLLKNHGFRDGDQELGNLSNEEICDVLETLLRESQATPNAVRS